MESTEKTTENMEKAISAMFQLWELGVTNIDLHDQLRDIIIKRYSHLKIPSHIKY